MGKQVKGWTPPQEDEVLTEAQTWVPPVDDEVIDPVKKKESASPSSSVSTQPGEPPEKSTEKSTPTKRLKDRVSNYITASQNSFTAEAERKKAELQQRVDADPTQTEQVNAEFQKFLTGRETQYNTDLDKWMGIYSEQFQKEDFEENKIRNPAESFAVNAWTTLSKDLPSQALGSKALVFSAFKKMDEKILKGAEDLLESAGIIDAKDRELDQSGANKVITDNLKKSIELSTASAENKKYLVDNLNKIQDGDFVDMMNYAASAVGQGVGQIPTSILTKGASSLVQQTGSIYLDSVQKIAEEDGISVEEVIKQGKDDVLYPLLFGIGTGMLDAIGAKGVAGAVSKKQVLDSFRKRALSVAEAGGKGLATEAGTEGVQTILEQIGVGKAAGKTWRETLKDFEWESVIESAIQGGIAGLFLSGGGKAVSNTFDRITAKVQRPSEVITQARETIDPTSPASVDAAAEVIENTIDNGDNIRTTDATGIQKVSEGNGQSETQETGGREGETVLPGPVQQGTVEERSGSTTEGDVSPEQRAESELQALVDSGGITREGNKITILTEEGGREAKRIYEELKKSKTEQQQRPDAISETTDNNNQQQEGGTSGSGVDTGQESSINTQESIEQQRPESENINQVTDETQPTPTPQQQEQQPSSVDESTSGIRPELPASDQDISQQDSGATRADSKKRTYAIAQRIFDSDADASIKKGVKEKGADYVPKGINITDTEAKNLIELYGQERAETLVRDTKNGITGDTRTALAARLYESYKQVADTSTDPETKRINYDRAVDIALTSAEQLKEAGRQTNAAKIWKAITSNEDMTVMAIEKENQRQGQKILEPIYKQVKRSRQQFDEQIQQLISKKIQEGVEARLKQAKLITQEQKKKISDAFDALKIKDVKGTANDITRVLGAAVWNGSIEAVKKAVLTGADLANAIQAGVDYVKQNFKGQWDEQQYRDTISPAVKSMVPEVDASQIDPAKIETPKISGKKKRDFINQVVDAHNTGKLTDEKFDQLYAKQLGAQEFSADERLKIRELAKTIAEVEQFEDQVKNDFTRQNIAKYKTLLSKAQKANADLQAFAQKPSNIWDTLISIMQGNLLTPLSLVTNIYSNAALQSLRFLSTGFGSVIDYSVSKLAKTGLLNQSYQDTSIDLVELQKGYFPGAWNGLIEGLKQLKTGPMADERSLREINNQFSPVRAIARWADGNRSTAQKVNDYVEGTIGWPAEVFFRLLNLGDKPYRRAAETARAMEIIKQKGLKGQEAEKFIMFPDAESAELISKAGDDATFQQESASAKFVQEWLSKAINFIGKTPIIGGPLKVIAKSQIPYVKTPWNIMAETLKYAAFPITGAVGIHQIAKGNKRGGSVLIGQAIVGAMIFAVAKELFIKGLLSWDEPYDQKAGKQSERRQIQYDNIPPNSLNVSAIQRGLLGGDWEIQDDDVWVNYLKMGVIGLLFDNYSNNYFTNIREDQQMPEQSEFYVDMLTTAPRVMSQSLDQSFLKGTNALLTALQDGGGYETEQWLINTSGALAAIIYPNTLTTVSKSADEFIRDTRDEEFVEKLKNTYKTKFFIGEQLPPKVNLWGDKITGTPEGRDKYAYYLWDPTKFKNVDTENFKYKLYQAWKESKFDDDYLPSTPRRDITYRKVNIPLNSEQYSKLAIYIGEQRKNLASTYINSVAFENKDRERVIKKLKKLYEEGAERGKKKFLMDMGWNILTPDKLSQINKKN